MNCNRLIKRAKPSKLQSRYKQIKHLFFQQKTLFYCLLEKTNNFLKIFLENSPIDFGEINSEKKKKKKEFCQNILFNLLTDKTFWWWWWLFLSLDRLSHEERRKIFRKDDFLNLFFNDFFISKGLKIYIRNWYILLLWADRHSSKFH